jgi:glycosyltransferase involved in cell wall biosynthesis
VVRVAAARTGGRFVYDIADLHVESGRLARLPRPLKAYLHRRERAWMAEAAGLTAVTAPLAEEVVRRYGVPRPIVVLNARPRWRPEEPTLPQTVRLRDAAGVPADRAILLYQGAFREDQGIEELLPALDSASLRDRPLTTVFLGFGRLETRLREAMARAPERIVVLPAVPSGELLEWTSGADLAFVGAPPRTVNLRLTIPNKLFESLMAGVPVVVAGGTAVARLVAQTDVGVVVDPWSSGALAAALAGVLDAPAADRAAARARARAAALERLNWETERDGLLGMYRRLAGG